MTTRPASQWRVANWSIVLLCVVPLVTQFHDLWQGAIPWFMDTVTQFYPLRLHAAHLLWQGELPLWNRTIFGGVPFLANPQWGLLYPGHYLLYPHSRSSRLHSCQHRSYYLVGPGHLCLDAAQYGGGGWRGAGLPG